MTGIFYKCALLHCILEVFGLLSGVELFIIRDLLFYF